MSRVGKTSVKHGEKQNKNATKFGNKYSLHFDFFCIWPLHICIVTKPCRGHHWTKDSPRPEFNSCPTFDEQCVGNTSFFPGGLMLIC
jgi:hypothetical protein